MGYIYGRQAMQPLSEQTSPLPPGACPGQRNGRRTQFQAADTEYPPTSFPCLKPGDWCESSGSPNTEQPGQNGRRTQYQTMEPRFTTGGGISPGQQYGRATQYQTMEPRFTTGGGISPGQTDQSNRNSPGQQNGRRTQFQAADTEYPPTSFPCLKPGDWCEGAGSPNTQQPGQNGRRTQYQTLEPRFTTGGGISPGQTDQTNRNSPGQQNGRTQFQAADTEYPPTSFPCMKPGDWCEGAGSPNTQQPGQNGRATQYQTLEPRFTTGGGLSPGQQYGRRTDYRGLPVPQDQCDPAMPSCRR